MTLYNQQNFLIFNMYNLLNIILLIIAALIAIINGSQGVPGPGQGLKSQYTVIPHRRLAHDLSQSMQSRAVDTRIQLEVLEGKPRGTIVGFIPIKHGFTYRFNEPPHEFVLDQNTGEIKTNAILDREVYDRYDLVVLSSQPTYPIEVRITVLDINDNAPEFPESSIAVSFSESSAPGTRLLLDAATDRDIGINSVTDDYRIIDGNYDDKFRLAVTKNPSGDVSYLHLETTGNLDRETCGIYLLNISARDGGEPIYYGYLQVNVTIVDVNDNPPIFDHSDYIVSLNESVPPGTSVLQVMASDNDIGDNSKITYYLSDTETQFSVDPDTGNISTTDNLECPQQNCQIYSRNGNNCPKSCVFTVFARDHGSPRQDGRTYVTVNLVDTNDHDPIIRFQYFPPTGNYATVDENAINGSVVAAVSVVDMDEGLNGETTIYILSGNEMKHFRLEKTPSFDMVRVNGILDREEINKYNLTIIAIDKGNPSRSATSYLIIHVNDVNDHEPVFEKSEYSTVLSELTSIGTYVASIIATDEDTGVNAQIYYDFISGNNQQWFHIDKISGLITTQKLIDRELYGNIELNISAHDGGPNPKWAYTQLKITILDENDEAPKFSQNIINITLNENIPSNTLVAMLTAIDHDQGINGSVTYQLAKEIDYKYPNTFLLDSITGQLTTLKILDRELISNYEILVIARDHGIPALSSTATVYLNINDENDNSPEFYPKKYFIHINDNIDIGTNIIKITATDRDYGENSIIKYYIENNDENLFKIDINTGIISLYKSLNNIQKSIFKLIIMAKDNAGRRSDINAIVEIIKKSKIEIINFDSLVYEFHLIEDFNNNKINIGREVGKVNIKSNNNNKFEYTIQSGDPYENFNININNGIITTAKIIDRELISFYSLTIIARSNLIYSKTIVNITINDLNDNSPIFLNDNNELIHIYENTAVGQELYIARAYDLDYGLNSRLTYSLTYNQDKKFYINEKTGVLYLNRSINYEPNTIINIEIQATDNGLKNLSTKFLIKLIIDDVNDHTPIFDHTSYETSLIESTIVNTRFFALSATDNDLNQNGKITYKIIDGNIDENFGIFPDGYLYVKKNLDRENIDYYSLQISCYDHGKPSRSSIVPVIIHIIDENDNPPKFLNTTFTFTILENEPIDSFVGKLTAVDNDIGRNAELIYSLINNNDNIQFSIDPHNGFIKTLYKFDREQLVHKTGKNYIQLDGIVSDNGIQRLKDKTKIKIYIIDINDNPPQFLRISYKIQISENTEIFTPLLRLYTIDIDDGINGIVYYKIINDNYNNQFSIDINTGQIILNKNLDRELKSEYKLLIMAYDGAIKNSLNTTTYVYIDILDENDNTPIFIQIPKQIDIIETKKIGIELIKFNATDSDIGLNSQIKYKISSGNRKDTFHIDINTGILYLHKTLDYEDIQQYQLNITASDCGNPNLSTTIKFIINIIDENDNPPSFPNTAIVRQIREGIPINTPIVTITAEDPDSGNNGKILYQLYYQEPKNQTRYFGINSLTGVIYTLKQIDRETIDTFRLTIIAIDQPQLYEKRLTAEKLVTVIVEDINDNAPIFITMNAVILPKFSYNYNIENDKTIIMYVKANDTDSSTNGLVTYEMVSGNNDLFKIHRTTGAIYLRKLIKNPDIRYQLAVKATDEAVQSERKSSDTYITIISNGNINKNNNNNDIPIFNQHNYFGSVYENEPAGTSILTVIAHLNNADIEYYVTNVTGDGKQVHRLFDIDIKLGILSTAAELDRESGVDSYEIEIYAIALGGLPRISSTKARVSVMDKNDSPPVFRNTPLGFTVSEDLGAGHAIGTVRATDPDTMGILTYNLIDGDDGKFLVEMDTGILRLRDTLDRETKDVYHLLIRVTDGVQYSETTVTVQVTDTNDNPPVFSEPVYSFDIPENAPRGYQVGIISATDPDLETNSVVSYTVISDWANDVFSLNPQTGVFTLTARLDYEEVQHYILVVQAQDNGHPTLSTTLTVYCNVLDLNDNAPIFDPMSYSNEIFENVSIGTSIVTVSATDIDSGDNGRIEYSITAGDENNDFEIAQNGTIKTKRKLDREEKNSYNLVVTARDCAQESEQKRLSSTVQVTVVLKDINDQSPIFISPNETSIMENIAINTVVMAIKAIDGDEGRNGYIEYSLSLESSVPFTLGAVDGILRVSGRLDRELRSTYTLTITARDRGESPRSSQTKVLVKILDENDNSPVFDPKQYSSSIAENSSIGAMVLQVSATDIDEGLNGRIRFSIADGDNNRDFSISEDSGVVRVAKNLNYERKSRYILSVKAEDCAADINDKNDIETRFDTAELTIIITDINDNPPTFLDSPYLAYVMENIIPPNNGYVITVKAYDADTPPLNSQVRYFLKEGDADLFRINASTGEISLLRALDRELQAEYTLTLVAMDTGSPPLTGTGTVRVVVQDMNDHSPQFSQQSYHASILENLPSNTKFLVPIANDKDAGLNSKIRYSLLGEKVERFHIDPDTGVITTTVSLDREETSIYYMSLMAQDSSTTEPRATVVNFTVVVEDINDNSPTFDSPTFNVNIPDRMKSGHFIFGAKATDMDAGENSRIKFSITGKDADKFIINESTGVIKSKVELSSIGQGFDKVYNIIMHATDCGTQTKTASADLTILLRPTHLFPTFSHMPSQEFVMSENSTEGNLITKVFAISPKKGLIGNIKYAIAGGNLQEAVKIDSETGSVTIGKGGLDYEILHQYEIWIEASDSDYPPLRSVLKIIVNVTDANDNRPEMKKSIYYTEILESETPPQFIAKILAKDIDSGENGEITYQLQNDFDGTFEINTDTGEIFTIYSLDREEIASYELIAEAVDQGMPQLTGTTTVSIIVLDKNDNPPRFTRLFSVNVTENADIDSFVIKVTSSDLDIGENANASYIFTDNPGNKFKIDSITGNVTVAAHLDREQQDEYLLKVAALDGSWRSETPLTITIQDQNDNAPEFEHSYYSFNFPELQRASTFVGQVIATDRDKQGPNSIISYSLQHPSDLFTIDPATGEIYSKRSIKYKHSQMNISPENMYSLTILATDNGKPPMYSESYININIVDANNNAPYFIKREYLAPAPEGADIGDKIIQVLAKDELDFGINAEIDYLITDGNGSDIFSINKENGWISVSKKLIYEINTIFILNIKATDRGVPSMFDEVTLTIIIAGENDYSPIFTALSYQVIVPENEPVGSTILTILAVDKDDGPNGMVRYSISGGNERKEFEVDPITGAIIILNPLDYDFIQEYHLNLTAEDLGYNSRSTIAMLTITLTDINDNAPIFNQSEYHAYLAENKPPNSFVYKMLAIDKDSPKNAIIIYAISNGNGIGYFNINPHTGILTSTTTFDYEEQKNYVLEIVASNPDSTMQGTTKILIHITGVNEFFPRFVQPVFHFDVSESAEIGTKVGIVQATDKDAGDDGKVYYLLVGSSNDKGFIINCETGLVTVSRNLDRETQSRVVLTLMAKNFGGIKYPNQTDEAQVIISIQDGNDPPVFLQQQYDFSISEDSLIGTKVLTVKAIDKDVRPQNNQFSYSIIGGNIDQTFKIEPQTGVIETSRKLDREKIDIYNLIIGAIDTGIPSQTGTTIVKINILDINDNGPTFNTNNIIGYVAENEPSGTSVMKLNAIDPDLPPNGAPFTYYLVGGKHKTFVNIDNHTGLITTTRSIDRETTPKLEINVEVEDNGKPKMRSQHLITINILDKNDSPSTSRSVHVLVNILNNNIPLGKIADIHPNDPDIIGDYYCKIITDSSSSPSGMLIIPNGCNLFTTQKTVLQDYSYSIAGSDGKHNEVISTVTVEFVSFDNSTITNSITIHINNITADYFLANYYHNFLDLLKSSFEYNNDVLLYSLRNVNNNSMQMAIACKSSFGYRSTMYLIDRLVKKQNVIQKFLQVNDIIVGYTPCNPKTCDNGGVCTENVQILNSTSIVDSKTLIFTSPLITHDFICLCTDGYTGRHCEKRLDPCLPNPCQANSQCRRQGYDFQCICPSHRDGKYCEKERGDICLKNSCRNGGSCRESPDGLSFFCLCRPGYRGNQCESVADSCRPNPCLYGGLCVSLKPGYKCSCIDGRYGRHCEKATFGFQELSYMAFPTLDAATNDISIIFATTKTDALLVYNYGTQSGGRSDFVAIEIIKGKAVFSFGGARTAITAVVVDDTGKSISNGKWHKITATRNGRVMSLSVSRCSDYGDICEECRPGDINCYSDDIGPTGTLNFNKQPLLIGGLSSADPVLERPGQIHSDDLVGCVHSISINGRLLNLSNPLHSRGILPTCDRNTNGGPCSQGHPEDPALALCGQFDECTDRWHTAMCRCGGYLLSTDCYNSLDPISLSEGGFIEFKISEKHRRMQLLENLYSGSNVWTYDVARKRRFTISSDNVTSSAQSEDPPKSLSLLFRTAQLNGLILFAATNKHYTLVELKAGKLVYSSRLSSSVNMTIQKSTNLANGKWHNLTLHTSNRILHLLVDGENVGDELDLAGVHDFLDPYLTALSIGGVRREYFIHDIMPSNFEGCFANFTINDEIQPFNGSGSVFKEVLTRGKVYQGCIGVLGIDAAQTADPLSIGITLVIVFFVILLVAILVSFVVFRFRKQQKEKIGGLSNNSGIHTKQNGGSTLLGGGGIVGSGNDCVLSRGLHSSDPSIGYHGDNVDIMRNIGSHHLVGPELISKKYKEREIGSNEHQRPQRPDIIEREVVSKSPPLREDHHPPIPPPNQSHHPHDHPNGVDLGNEFPEHYDLENASSIAPSDIDIVYHYKGYREAAGMRKYKATPPPVASYTHHKHQASQAQQQQHRHSPHHAGPYGPRVPPQTSQQPQSSTPRQHQSTPLARLSPSSELSSQQPRILTLHDISGKPLQSALLATTSSSGGVGKDALHSNSERSLNSPVMSQLSGQSSSASRKNPGVPPQASNVNSIGNGPIGLTAIEIERLNARPRTSSLVSTLDAVSSSSEAPRPPGTTHHLTHMHHAPDVDTHSSTSTDESGNDSFTCSEIEYDNNSLNGDKYNKSGTEGDRRSNDNNGNNSSKLPILPPAYDGFDSSFRGSLSTLVASDDDLSTHMNGMYRQPNGTSSSTTTLGWDYLLNWGPNFESLMGVFKDIAELPDSVNGHVSSSSLRIPSTVQKPSEEYV